jgi:hypothetical protein
VRAGVKTVVPLRRRALVLPTILGLGALAYAQEPAPQFEVATLKLSPPPAAASLGVNLGTF